MGEYCPSLNDKDEDAADHCSRFLHDGKVIIIITNPSPAPVPLKLQVPPKHRTVICLNGTEYPFDMDHQQTLLDLRFAMSEQLPNPYLFIYDGDPVAQNQERTLTIEKVLNNQFVIKGVMRNLK